MTASDDDTPPYLLPFVLPIEPVAALRDGAIDWYVPADGSSDRSPAVVFVHGGPLPPWVEPTPRGWPSYQAYGAWAAGAGLVGVVPDHRFSGYDAFDVALADLDTAIEATRSHPRVDPDRIVLWGFSGAGMLLGHWLAQAPTWLRGMAATYPCCRPLEDAPQAPVTLADAVAEATGVPLLLTRVGLERDEVAETVTEFVTAATAVGATVDIIDVPHGHHGFDQVDPGEESQAAVRAAMGWVQDLLR